MGSGLWCCGLGGSPWVGGFVCSDSFASVESVKAASDVYSPCDGVVVAINEELADDPALVNADAEGRGWLVEFKVGHGAGGCDMCAGC